MTIKTEPLPEGLEEFILSQFQTVSEVEVLCCFIKHRGDVVTSKTICQRIFLSDTKTSLILTRLVSLGFITMENNLFKYVEGNTAEEKSLLTELCRVYDSRKSVIVELLFNTFLKGPS